MASWYVDTSALLKLYVTEVGSNWISATITIDETVVNSLTTAEMGVALIRRVRDGTLSTHDGRLAWRRFRQDCHAFAVMPVDRRMLVRAVGVAGRASVPLRTLDAIQLQGAVDAAAVARSRGQPPPLFITADERQERAAQALGFATDNPLRHP
jgi:predicted nucleic acid-binding protein